MSWTVVLSRQAVKDIEKIKQACLGIKIKYLLDLLESNPFTNPPRYEALVGNLKGYDVAG